MGVIICSQSGQVLVCFKTEVVSRWMEKILFCRAVSAGPLFLLGRLAYQWLKPVGWSIEIIITIVIQEALQGFFLIIVTTAFLYLLPYIYLTFIWNIKSVTIIPPPSHPLPPLPTLTLRHREHWTRKLNSSQTQVFILLFFFWSQQPVLVRVIIDMGAFRWPHFWKFILAHLSAFKMIRGNSQL